MRSRSSTRNDASARQVVYLDKYDMGEECEVDYDRPTSKAKDDNADDDLDEEKASGEPEEPVESEEAVESEESAESEEELVSLMMRSNFNPLANFTAVATVDNNGLAQIPISIPDNLTRYRYDL